MLFTLNKLKYLRRRGADAHDASNEIVMNRYRVAIGWKRLRSG
jgi:hypothetical protein